MRLALDQTLERRSWHEAGHAIVAAACGFEPTRCDILPGPERLGHFEHRELTDAENAAYWNDDRDLLIRLSLISFGGHAGEILHAAEHGGEPSSSGWHRDLQAAIGRMLSFGVEDVWSLVPQLVDRSVELLKEERRLMIFKAVAAELLAHGGLGPKRLLEIYNSVPIRSGPLQDFDRESRKVRRTRR